MSHLIISFFSEYPRPRGAQPLYDALDEILGTRTPSMSDSNPSSNYMNTGRSDRGEYSNIRNNGNGNSYNSNGNSNNGNGNSYNGNGNNINSNNSNNNRDYNRIVEPQTNMRGGTGGHNYQNDNGDEYSSLSRISGQQGPGSRGTTSNFSARNDGGTSQYKLKPDDYGYDREYNGVTEDTIL